MPARIEHLLRVVVDRSRRGIGRVLLWFIAPESLIRHRVFGPRDRLTIDPSAAVADTVFNTVSGSIAIGRNAFFGHGVQVLTGSHDVDLTGEARMAFPAEGRDVVVEEGAWIASGAIVLGPARIGRNAVVAAGAVVSGDVPDDTIVGGIPARPLRRIAASR